MIGTCTAKRCGRLMSSASIRATTSVPAGAEPGVERRPEADVAVEFQHVDGDGARRGQLGDAVGERRATGPSRTITTWSGRRVWSSTVERNAAVRCRVGRVATRAAAATAVRARRLLFVTV
jgi:hypothetical protein